MILTMLDANIWPHCFEMYENKEQYARRCNEEFLCATVPKDWTHPPAVYKLHLIREQLHLGNDVWWMDMDVMVMHYGRNLPYSHLPIAMLEESPEYLCTGVMFLREGQTSLYFVNDWLEKYEADPQNKHPWEQATLNSEAMSHYTPYIHHGSAMEYGAFARELWHPGNRYWTPGDHLLHLGGATWPERRKLYLEKYQSQVSSNGW